MKKFIFTMAFVGLLNGHAQARVGDPIPNRCQVISIEQKSEIATAGQWGRDLKLRYTTLLATLNCESPMQLEGDLVLHSPFQLAFHESLQKSLSQLANSKETVDAIFINHAFFVKPSKLGSLTHFPDPREPAYLIKGGSLFAMSGEPIYNHLDQVLDQTGAEKIPVMEDGLMSWRKTFHFLSSEGDFEMAIAQQGPSVFKGVNQIPLVRMTVAYIRTPEEMSRAKPIRHQLSTEDSQALRALIGEHLKLEQETRNKIDIDCRSQNCSVLVLTYGYDY